MAPSTQYLILGAGYTGGRVAAMLEQQGRGVFCLSAHESEGAARFDVLDASTHGALSNAVEPGARVLYSLPVLRTPAGYQGTASIVAP